MPHGDFSDYAALGSFVLGMTTMFAPQLYFAGAGPLKPMFNLAEGASPDAAALFTIRFAGGLFAFMGPLFFVVRWNIINGKAAALGLMIFSINTVYLTLAMDNFAFVLRGWYL